MATIRFNGMEEIEKAFMAQADGAAEKVEKMLIASAEINAQAQKRSIEAHRLVDTGAMRDSVRPTKVKKSSTGAVLYVYPQGKDHKGTRNAVKAFVKEYGTDKVPGTRWMTAANESCADEILEEQFRIWTEGSDGSG